MARGRKTDLMVDISPEDDRILQSWQRSTIIPNGLAKRGRIILLMAQQMPISRIAVTVGISRRFVYKWVYRFLKNGMDGLRENKRGRVPHDPLK